MSSIAAPSPAQHDQALVSEIDDTEVRAWTDLVSLLFEINDRLKREGDKKEHHI